MLGQFQQSCLRIELEASAGAIAASLTVTKELRRWLFPQQLDPKMPERLTPGAHFRSWLGPISVHHHVDLLSTDSLRLILSEGVDGFHEWYWGEGWVQSRVEGISLLPINLGQTTSLWRLQQYLNSRVAEEDEEI